MRPSFVGFAILSLWASSSFARATTEEEIENLRKLHKWAPRAADEYGPPDPNWDEDAAVRSLSPAAFPDEADASTSSSDHADLKRRDDALSLEIASFNMQPNVVNDDPIALRKNPMRKHQEYFCYWRTPRPGFSPQNAYDAVNGYLETLSIEMCSGPGGYCTPVFCKNHYVVAVCNWNKKPWQLRCYDLMLQARDIAVAVGNNYDELWETGINPTVSEQQKAMDRRKLCVSHSSVYTPEMIGYTFFNTNPHFQIQLYYGFPDDRITCDTDGTMFNKVVGDAKSQDDYEWDWFSVATEKKLDELEQEASKDDKGNPKPGVNPDLGKKNGTKDDSGLPSPVEEPKDDGEGGKNYKGPNLKDYDPIDFIPPDQVRDWRVEQWRKSHSAEIASAHKAAHKSRPPKNYTVPTLPPAKATNSFPAGYAKSVKGGINAGFRSQASQHRAPVWATAGAATAAKTGKSQIPVQTSVTVVEDSGKSDTPSRTESAAGVSKSAAPPAASNNKPMVQPVSTADIASKATRDSAPSAANTDASSTAVSASKTSDTEPPVAASAVKTASMRRPFTVSAVESSATTQPSTRN
ncbi:hypothetical protein Dda_0113 [Drechslerella dactyloides]|uniref:Uncharacterized protein n=1 Tax=Drechslerella dactyloides TaxID=74499 RepID=A0AAD6J459_DREDA|nr:hypothetical protein Dda_0113 [Drechslerella dactyloides]